MAHLTSKFTLAAGLLASAVIAGPAQAQDLPWAPEGPVNMIIAFQAGGGADSLARLLAEELNTRHGWEVIPENVTGRGGVVAAQELASAPADGTTVAVSVTEATTYAIQATRDPGYDLESFTYISTLTGTQMGIISQADRGWANLGDMIAAAQAGEQVTVGAMSQKLADATYVLGRNNDVDFTVVMTGGGRGGVNAVVAADVDAAWSAGAQTQGVLSGELVNLTSAEGEPLRVSPDAPLIQDFNFGYDMGVMFLVMAPAGIPEEAHEAWTVAIETILADEESQLTQLTNRVFSGPRPINRGELAAFMQQSFDDAGALIEDSSN